MRRTAWLVVIAMVGCGREDDRSVELDSTAGDCRDGVPLDLPGTPGHVVAVNAYFLQEEAARALRRGEANAGIVEEVFAKVAALGVRVVRTNGFNDDRAKAGDSAIQLAPLVYDEVALRGLDLVLTRAAAHGVRLVLPLGNLWDDYGGARQYVAWAGLARPEEGDGRFFTERSVVDHYREHVRRMLDRVDAFDGIRYGDHPAVLAWELLNEPRGRGLDRGGWQLRSWVDELGAHVKRLAPGHLVGAGEEGLDAGFAGYDARFWAAVAPALFAGGASFRLNAASPFVDFASVHVFPDAWGVPATLAAAAGARWIGEHAEIARAAGKPLMVAEFGLRSDDALSLAERRAAYRDWFRCARRVGAAGAAPWGFADDARPDAWDPYTFRFRDGTAPEDPANRYADLVKEAATR